MPRTLPIARALYCADQSYWAIRASGMSSEGLARAIPGTVIEALRRAGKSDRLDDRLRMECAAFGLTFDQTLRLSLKAMGAVSD